MVHPRPPRPPGPASVAGEALCAAGRTAEAIATSGWLRSCGPAGSWPDALAARIEGLLAVRAGDPDAARAAFAESGRALDHLAIPYFAAVSWLDWAATAQGEPDDAVRVVAERLAVLEGLGARPAADRARRLLRALGGRPSPPRTARRSGDLTQREHEVAALVAEGLSNAEIADRLFISPRTVTTHLVHIYDRLGLTTRTALTRYVVGGRASQDT